MFMIIKKKQIIFLVVGVIILTVILLNVNSNNSDNGLEDVVSETDNIETPDSGEAVLVSTNEDYFLKAKNDRDIVRSKACELLNDTIDNPSISEENKRNAEEKIIEMSVNMDKELKCESILSAKGFKKSVVFISDSNITVTIDSTDIKESDIIKINDIIFQETGNNNIKIVEVR